MQPLYSSSYTNHNNPQEHICLLFFYFYFLFQATSSSTFLFPLPFTSNHHIKWAPPLEQPPPHHLGILPPILNMYVDWTTSWGTCFFTIIQPPSFPTSLNFSWCPQHHPLQTSSPFLISHIPCPTHLGRRKGDKQQRHLHFPNLTPIAKSFFKIPLPPLRPPLFRPFYPTNLAWLD